MTAKGFWRRATPAEKVILCVDLIAFLGAGRNHVVDLLRGGLFPYSAWWGVPPALNAYWTLLTVADFLSVLVLLLDLRAGVALYFAVMLSDVAVNWYAEIVYWKTPLIRSYGLMMQTSFLLFLLLTSRRLLGVTRRDASRPPRR